MVFFFFYSIFNHARNLLAITHEWQREKRWSSVPDGDIESSATPGKLQGKRVLNSCWREKQRNQTAAKHAGSRQHCRLSGSWNGYLDHKKHSSAMRMIVTFHGGNTTVVVIDSTFIRCAYYLLQMWLGSRQETPACLVLDAALCIRWSSWEAEISLGLSRHAHLE